VFGVSRKCSRVVFDVVECFEVFGQCKSQSVSRDELGAV
jgi:hypothetical protein